MIEEMWKEFVEALFGADGVSSVQYNEMRNAFYGGATALFFRLNRQVRSGAEITTADLALMDEINNELHAYMAGLLEQILKQEPRDG